MTETQKGRIFDAANWGFSHKEIARLALGMADHWKEVANMLYRHKIRVTDYRNRNNANGRWVARVIRADATMAHIERIPVRV